MWNMNMMDDFQRQWEKMVKDWFDQLLQNPEFLQTMGKSMEGALSSKNMMDNMKEQLAKSMSVPTAETVGKIGRYIVSLEAKVADLEDVIYEQKNDISEMKEMLSVILKQNKKKSAATKKTGKTASKKKTTQKTAKGKGKSK